MDVDRASKHLLGTEAIEMRGRRTG
jgi:hypothetical protein